MTVGNYDVENSLLAGSPTAPSPLMSGSVPGCFSATTLEESAAKWHQHNGISRPKYMELMIQRPRTFQR